MRATIKIESQVRNVDFADIINRSPIRSMPNAKAILAHWWEVSDKVWVASYNSDVACMMGVLTPTFISDAAYIWFIHTNLIEEHKFLFIRHSQLFIEEILKEYPRLEGDVMNDNKAAKRWLAFLGAQFHTPDPFKTPFTIEKRLKH